MYVSALGVEVQLGVMRVVFVVLVGAIMFSA